MGIYAKKGEGIMRYTTMASPVGELLLLSDGSCLTGVYMARDPDPSWQREDALPVFAPVREWLRDCQDACPGHRHISHLFALYPSHEITPADPAAFAAARAPVRSAASRCWHPSCPA